MASPQFDVRDRTLPRIEDPVSFEGPIPTEMEKKFHRERKKAYYELMEWKKKNGKIPRFSKSGVPLVKGKSDD